jgi:hypothetical protein
MQHSTCFIVIIVNAWAKPVYAYLTPALSPVEREKFRPFK